ncbi:MAG: hypothetical protein MMC23_002460 [Stictis urceolatum]|nr:hypothetical protein [Stictis urceolata]
MENVCIPIHLDAFALSEDCCSGASTIAPYSQPNYVSLRLNSHLIQHDIQDHVAFHLARDPKKNPRIANVGNPNGGLEKHRMGIHLHWTLLRFYRTADSVAQNAKTSQTTTAVQDAAQPKFKPIPNRWLVVRHVKSCEPANVLPTYQPWVIESDVWRNITVIADGVDLESGVSPFVAYGCSPTDVKALDKQAEVFPRQQIFAPGLERR